MTLPGPSKTIIVEPLERPAEAPVPEPTEPPERDPEPEKVPLDPGGSRIGLVEPS